MGLSGKDGGMIACEGGRTPELGLVGRPVAGEYRPAAPSVHPVGFIPVIAPLGMGQEGETYNINGETLSAGTNRAPR